MKNLKFLSVCLFMGLLFASCEKETLSETQEIEITSSEDPNADLAAKAGVGFDDRGNVYVDAAFLTISNRCYYGKWGHYWIEQNDGKLNFYGWARGICLKNNGEGYSLVK